MSVSPKRRRLSPNERKREILDAAYRLVLLEGVSTLTMEKIACEAESSKALLYNYFPNISDLLQALYKRELNNLQQQQLDALSKPYEFEEMVKRTNRINREHRSDRKLLIKHLEADARVKQAMAKTDQKNRSKVVEFLSEEILDNYKIPRDIAVTAVRLAMQYDEKDSLHALDSGDKQDEIWGAMMVGAMQELEKRFGKKGDNNE